MDEDISISIDGPTASGKTTLAGALAGLIGATFLDTGLTFRALAYAVGTEQLSPDCDWRSLVEHRPPTYPREKTGTTAPVSAAETTLAPVPQPSVRYRGRDILADIWRPELDQHLMAVAADPRWRVGILDFHRDVVAARRPIIAVGRDVAGTLLPEAVLHVCLVANVAVRRARRRAQYRGLPGRSVAVGPATRRDEEIHAMVRSRPNAIVLDTTYLPASAVAAAVERRLRSLVQLREPAQEATRHE